MLALFSGFSVGFTRDIAAPVANGKQLHSSPSIWLSEGFLTDQTVDHMIAQLPAAEASWEPCIGQVCFPAAVHGVPLPPLSVSPLP